MTLFLLYLCSLNANSLQDCYFISRLIKVLPLFAFHVITSSARVQHSKKQLPTNYLNFTRVHIQNITNSTVAHYGLNEGENFMFMAAESGRFALLSRSVGSIRRYEFISCVLF